MASIDRAEELAAWREFLASRERAVICTRAIPAAAELRTGRLPAGLDVLVVGDPDICGAHAGNLIAALQERGASVRRVDAPEEHDPSGSAELIIGAAVDAEVPELARGLAARAGQPIGVLSFPTPENRVAHLAVGGTGDDLEAVEAALAAHDSQIARTDYLGVLRSAMTAAAARARMAGLLADPEAPGADMFSVATLDSAGRCTAAADGARWELVAPGAASAPGRTPIVLAAGHQVLAVSPHPDDTEVAAGLFVRAALRAGATVHNVLHSGGHRGVTAEYPCAAALARMGGRGTRAVAQAAAAIGVAERAVHADPELLMVAVRLAETLAAAEALAAGIPAIGDGTARVEVVQLAVDRCDVSAAESRLRQAYAEVLERHLRNAAGAPWTVVLPHPDDAHPRHRSTTEHAIAVLRELAPRAGTIHLLFYRAPWSGSSDTYFLSSGDVAAAVGSRRDATVAVTEEKRALAILVGELAARRFGLASPPPAAMGGEYAEAFRRRLVLP